MAVSRTRSAKVWHLVSGGVVLRLKTDTMPTSSGTTYFSRRLSPLERRLLSCWIDDDRRCTKLQETSCGEHAENVDRSFRVAVVCLADFDVPNAVPVRDKQCSDKEDVSEHYGASRTRLSHHRRRRQLVRQCKTVCLDGAQQNAVYAVVTDPSPSPPSPAPRCRRRRHAHSSDAVV